MEKSFGKIETYGDNCCFVARPYGNDIPAPEKIIICKPPVSSTVKPKPEKVHLKFGKVRIQVTSAKRVKVRESGEELIIALSEENEK